MKLLKTIIIGFFVLSGCALLQPSAPLLIDDSKYPRLEVFIISNAIHDKAAVEEALLGSLLKYQVRPNISKTKPRPNAAEYIMTIGEVDQTPNNITGNGAIPSAATKYKVIITDTADNTTAWSTTVVVTSSDQNPEDTISRRISETLAEDKVFPLRPAKSKLWESRGG